MSVLDTPTKAARCGRPNTRHWSDLLAAAREDETEANRLRDELSHYIARADKFSARREARRANRILSAHPSPTATSPPASASLGPSSAKSATPRRAKKVKRPEGADQPEHGAEPEIPDWTAAGDVKVTETLKSLRANWTERVAALRALRARTGTLSAPLVAALGVQLGDLRSRIVVEASETIVARAPDVDAAHAESLLEAALAGVAVKKAVMADAREAAALGALRHVGNSDAAWAVIGRRVSESQAERARAVCVRAVTAWAKGTLPASRDVQIATLLSAAVVDRAPAVREAGRELFTAFADVHGAARADQLRESVTPAARERLPANAKAKPVKMSIQEKIRLHKKAMKEQFAARKAAAAASDEGIDLPDAAVTDASVVKDTVSDFQEAVGTSSRSRLPRKPSVARPAASGAKVGLKARFNSNIMQSTGMEPPKKKSKLMQPAALKHTRRGQRARAALPGKENEA